MAEIVQKTPPRSVAATTQTTPGTPAQWAAGRDTPWGDNGDDEYVYDDEEDDLSFVKHLVTVDVREITAMDVALAEALDARDAYRARAEAAEAQLEAMSQRMYAAMERAARAEAMTRMMESELAGVLAPAPAAEAGPAPATCPAPAPCPASPTAAVVDFPSPSPALNDSATIHAELRELSAQVAALVARSDSSDRISRLEAEVASLSASQARPSLYAAALPERSHFGARHYAQLPPPPPPRFFAPPAPPVPAPAAHVSALADAVRIRELAHLRSSPTTHSLVLGSPPRASVAAPHTPAHLTSFAAMATATPPSRKRAPFVSPIRMPASASRSAAAAAEAAAAASTSAAAAARLSLFQDEPPASESGGVDGADV
ncbi:uncharacterized protein AMSG_01567 [Thecamonas trahens ATCC 50062]|uniref:Uncharacterized protein n=1 Tax=Thecamonas trahens ATCC 50062 TaxID=461836 RepID=A0A0L0DR07_THETB|nr:hypothetical protein AMSG_01567 [Thecamonas trahens ATCC 50062]KNC54717.1 hypothetical protein AMSG_01567 [Thecamonas trahens ATCC 50062]|eukprot:XP_013761617.1 hypothetical protein AMSG_01567 [Thecamonas trahens ATCC 50062]